MKLPESPITPKKANWCVCAFLFLLVLGIYFKTFGYGFINYDDNVFITSNPPISNGLTLEGIQWAFTKTYQSYWNPITWISHMIDCELYGLNANGHHVTSALFHALNASLLFILLLKITFLAKLTQRECFWCSVIIATLFAIHPLRVESVAWISERKDLVSGFFFLLCLLAYLSYAKFISLSKDKAKALSYILVLIFYALGLMSKPMLVTTPCVLLLLDFWPLNRVRLNSLLDLRSFILPILEKAPLFIMSVIISMVTLTAQEAAGAIQISPLYIRFGNTCFAYAAYLEQTVMPTKLAMLYPYIVFDMGVLSVVAAFSVLVACTFFVFKKRLTQPYLLMGWFWFVGILAPTVGLVERVGLQGHADRYTYLAQIGLLICIVFLILEYTRNLKYRKSMYTIVVATVVASLSILSWQQTKHWKDSFSIWKHTINVTENNSVALYYYGHELYRLKKDEEAAPYYERSIEINPYRALVNYEYAVILKSLGRHTEAKEYFRKAKILGYPP